jgi:hypothetical protein
VDAVTVRVLKWNVAVDDQVHYIGSGEIVHVDCQSDPSIVQVWTEEVDEPREDRAVIVVGTGHEYPRNRLPGHGPGHWHAVGTVPTRVGLVWHVLKFVPCNGDVPEDAPYVKGSGYIRTNIHNCTIEEEHAG